MSDTTVTLSSVITRVAKARNIDTTKAGKLTRSYIRRNDDKLRKDFSWPPKAKVKADGNRYTPMSKATANALVKALSPKS
jgi:hypothetical protein